MHRLHLYLLVGVALSAHAQTVTRQNLSTILGFENNTRGGVAPAGWNVSPANSIFVDDQVFRSGKYSARLERTSTTASTFSNVSTTLPLDFNGQTLVWRGFIKTEDVSDYVALWMREDGDAPPSVAFASLQSQQIRGTRDWTEFSISVPILPAGRQIVFGVLLGGTGKAWVDDLQLLVDGTPVGEIKTPLDIDREFDGGSRIILSRLTEAQIRNLALLAKVWGFVKYHHPAVTTGTVHWDYSLFRVLPRVLDADSEAARRLMLSWIESLGPVEECTTCAELDTSRLYMPPRLEWIEDTALLGSSLSQKLVSIHRNRKIQARQFYISLVPGVANPQFNNEPDYRTVRFPDNGFQLLALFRYWNMVEYFSPYRDIMADDFANDTDYWERVLLDFIPRIGLASSPLIYQQELMRFIAKINDTHANLWTSIGARPPLGACYLPVDVRFVEGRAYVIRHKSPTEGPASGIQPGDLIEELDGVRVSDLVQQWTPIYAASNEPTRLRDIGNYLTRGACGETTAVVQRGEELLRVRPRRVATNLLDFSRTSVHDLPGATFQKLADDIGYLKLSSVQAAQSANYVRAAEGTKGLIIDIRNYPSEFVVFTLGQLLVSERSEFVRFTRGDMTNPGAFHWDTAATALVPQQPRYTGKVVILIDEVTQSQAEYTTMAFRTAPGAIVIGSTTAGADGNVSTILLPGGLSSYISGIGVFYPDNRPTQRIGIIPDIEVKPTIAALREGRDELIEEAIRQIRNETP